MSTQEVFVQQFARLFRHYQEALNPAAEDPGQLDSEPWHTITSDERNRMMAAARLAITEMETTARLESDSRKYYAKPGSAEWGC